MSPRRDEGKLVRRKTAGPSLHFNLVAPDAPAEAVVALLPGYADHAARYAHVMDAWAERGLASVAVDLRGHGRAEGARGFCDRFSEYVDDVTELVALIDHLFPAPRRFLFGHSFGGLVATTAVLADPTPWRGLVLSSPFFGVAMPIPAAKRFAGKIVSRLFPRVGLPSGLHGRDVTHDAARANAYDSDPLSFKNANARWFTESEEAQTRAIARARELSAPLYVFMGTADRIAKVERAREFSDAAGSVDKTWVPHEGLYHETLNEIAWRPIADAVASWLLSHR